MKNSAAGSTASITAYNGKHTFITATLGDSTTFVAVYGKDGKPLGVRRLHDVLHNPKDSKDERKRIKACGGYISRDNRVGAGLAITRALGDVNYKSEGVIADATIDIWTLEQLCEDLKINAEDVGKMQLIVACDGLTEQLKTYPRGIFVIRIKPL
jgi:integrin-linked kinase-associated serine/threonine phosphatase 2C